MIDERTSKSLNRRPFVKRFLVNIRVGLPLIRLVNILIGLFVKALCMVSLVARPCRRRKLTIMARLSRLICRVLNTVNLYSVIELIEQFTFDNICCVCDEDPRSIPVDCHVA